MVISSLAKVFPDKVPTPENFELTAISGETVSFQIAFLANKGEYKYTIKADDKLKISVYQVGFVPIEKKQGEDDFILNEGKPGLYPDALFPVDGRFEVTVEGHNSLWLDVVSDAPGDYEISVELSGNAIYYNEKQKIRILDVKIPKSDLKFTNWFHCDCLATHYNVEVFSEEHWRILENFLRTAARHGMNMVLTPLFTPPLDTAVGGERPTVQLVDIVQNDGKYSFSFEKLDRWVNLCKKCGIEFFELSHLFTQWGAKFCPKIMATVDGEYRRIFGWEDKSDCTDYRNFLNEFLPKLDNFIISRNLSDKIYYHVSDEPGENDIDNYKICKNQLKILEKYQHIDALSEREFYDMGLVKIPVPGETSADKFSDIDAEKWVYYCCGPGGGGYCNRFIHYPSIRTRALGLIMFKKGVSGFLHWGYNFWYSQYSLRQLDPYRNTTADGNFPAGDGFDVYPGENGEAICSIRIKQIRDMISDYNALFALSEKCGRSDALKFLPENLDYNCYTRNSEDWIKMRNLINFALKS